MKRGSVISTVICIVLMVALYFGGSLYHLIHPKGEAFGMAYNSERQRRGILPLPKGWTNDYTGDTKEWYPPQRPDSGVFRSSKLVAVDDDEIQYEDDNITNKHAGITEKLTMHYDFDADTHPWSFSYSASGMKQPVNFTLVQADSLLQAWNFKEINLTAL
jgi:hypothetical protein